MSEERMGPSSAPRSGLVDAVGTRTVDVETLLAGAREMVLIHKGERYRLRVTQNGKLILTK